MQELPTIFANFRTFIRLYFTIFHGYIAALHGSSTLQLYCHSSMSHPYVCCSIPHHVLHACTLLHITSPPPRVIHVTCQVLGPSWATRSTTHRMHVTCNRSGPFRGFPTSLPPMSDPSPTCALRTLARSALGIPSPLGYTDCVTIIGMFRFDIFGSPFAQWVNLF